jgi:hypothetical protein
MRRLQNHSAYIKRNHLRCPTLPITLLAFAHQPLRATDLFTQAFQGGPKYDVPDLGLTAHPYHKLPQLLHSSLIRVDGAAQLDVRHTLNGNQLRHLQEMGRRRYADASGAGGFEASTRRLLEELEDRIRQWERICDQGAPLGEQEGTVYNLCIEWGAKVIFGMHGELEARNQGWDFYHASYAAKELAWQNVNLY